MNASILREFCHRSREWSRAKRGMELFEMAAMDLREFVDADSGCFVYRKRILTNGIAHQKAHVYAPWGVFADNEDRLQRDIDCAQTKLDSLTPFVEQWTLMEDLPVEWHELWSQYNLREVGIWPLVSREQMIGAIVAARTHSAGGESVVTRTALMDSCAAQVSLALDLILTSRLAEELSQRDLLTGLLNRRGLEARVQHLIQACKDSGQQLVLCLIDMDGLKSINDTLGHPAGDSALRQLADIVSRNVRGSDVVSRLGGDEFAVLMQCDRPNMAVERIRQAVKDQSNGLSVSVGHAVWSVDGESLERCYQVADERLYACKRLKRKTKRFASVYGDIS